MSELFILLFVAVVGAGFLFLWAGTGHLLWLAIAWFADQLKSRPSTILATAPSTTLATSDLLATERQLKRFYLEGKLTDELFSLLSRLVDAERFEFSPAKPRVVAAPKSDVHQPKPDPIDWKTNEDFEASPTPPMVHDEPLERERELKTPPTFLAPDEVVVHSTPVFEAPAPRSRRTFTEVLNAFMEESNIRWGEIIGGLLIIGCSTALTVSLWSEISRIPVLKFLIFTTVTAVLFGVGLYTEHRWKLPTTSRGILTISTLLVPLNFLAIAAVSSNAATGALVIGSELLAPAIFLCLVYFAGRIITPGCAHLLSAGVLGSSVGQLLVRHFAGPDLNPWLLISLAAFPVVCYAGSVGLVLRRLLSDSEIDESETTTLFTVIGTMSFAALLPFGLLLYRCGSLGITVMYVAPIISIWGLPLLASGTVLWRRINDQKLVASRTTGTALGIFGVIILLAGLVLAWPNPASIVPTALINFAIFTTLAVVLELPAAHVFAALCLSLAYLVIFQVYAGNVAWENLKVQSLLRACLSAVSGESLAAMFIACLFASEGLSQRSWAKESRSYLAASCLVALISLGLIAVYGLDQSGPVLWLVFGAYSLGAFWIGWRQRQSTFSWIGCALLLLALQRCLLNFFGVSFPWQTAFFVHASLCAAAALVCSRLSNKFTWQPLHYASLLSSLFAVVCMFQGNPWQETMSQAERIFWLAGIWLAALFLTRARLLFVVLQVSLTAAAILTVKAVLQEYEWYAFLPHAFMHPWGLQIQGTILVLMSLVWVAVRMTIRRQWETRTDTVDDASQRDWRKDWWRLLNTNFAIDQLVLLTAVVGFFFLTLYGSLSGLASELLTHDTNLVAWDIAGFSHVEALGPGSWMLLGLLAVTTALSWYERRRSYCLTGMFVVIATSIPLIAGRFENQIATATAWRMLAALMLILGSVLIWNQQKIARFFALDQASVNRIAQGFKDLLFTFSIVPLTVLTLYPAFRAVLYQPLYEPAAGLFALFDRELLYGLPLLTVALVFIVYAIKERLAGYAMLAGICFNVMVTVLYLFSVAAVNGSMDRVVLVTTLQSNALTLALFGLVWLSQTRRWTRWSDQETEIARFWLRVQVALAQSLIALLVIPTLLALVVSPVKVGSGTLAVAGLLGWLALGFALIFSLLVERFRSKGISVRDLTSWLLATGSLLTFTVAKYNLAPWAGIHTLLLVFLTLSLITLVLSRLDQDSESTEALGPYSIFVRYLRLDHRWQSDCRFAFKLVAAIAIFLALRVAPREPVNHWWPVGSLVFLAAMFAVFSSHTLKRRYLCVAAILVNIATSIGWLRFSEPASGTLTSFIEVNVIAATICGIAWLGIELRSRRLREVDAVGIVSVHSVISLLAFLSLLLIAWLRYMDDAFSSEYLWPAVVSAAALLVASLWDNRAKYATAGLYLLGLLCGVLGWQQLDMSIDHTAWSVTIFLAVYALATSAAWYYRQQLLRIAQRLNMPERLTSESSEFPWLIAFNFVAVLVATTEAFWIDLRVAELNLRVSAALAITAQALTFSMLTVQALRKAWQRMAFGVFMIGSVLFGWALLTPQSNGIWLNRSVVMMVTCFLSVASYSATLSRLRSRWPTVADTIRSGLPYVLAGGLMSLMFCLGTEVAYRISFAEVYVSWPATVTIGSTLIAVVVACLIFALRNEYDPLNLSDGKRMTYIYVAELMLGLLVLHLRLTMPWLFTGFFTRYWPIVVMAIAYLGVCASEALKRRNLLVLSEPLARTGAFLPLLPVIGFWLAHSEVDYSALLIIVGSLYCLLSITRRSFVWGILAAVAGNGGLWYWLQRTNDYQFLQHPQLWLIPAALSVLIAAHLNEKSLTTEQMAGLRYFSLLTIYVSSTSDIFINGVANSPWLPLILASLSLAGVFSGIMFRIRGLLLLGSVFLLLAVTTMIWYASVNLGWTWLWYVAGIATGASIIFMFAIFEKKRSEVLRVVDGFKEWQP